MQLAAVLGHFSTVPQLLPVLGRASGSHAGHRDSQAALTIIGNLTPILGTVNVKRSFELSSKKTPENVLLANSCEQPESSPCSSLAVGTKQHFRLTSLLYKIEIFLSIGF